MRIANLITIIACAMGCMYSAYIPWRNPGWLHVRDAIKEDLNYEAARIAVARARNE